jgi:hypothetical protein
MTPEEGNGMQSSPDASDLEDHDAYQSPQLMCDVVMKGGITSGVIYPWAVCEIAREYRLRNIGGTSAGAIAAAAAAAAEVGRRTKGAGFARLAALPGRVSRTHQGQSDSVLFNLFQPSDATRPYFQMLTAGLRKKDKGAKVGRILLAAFRGAPLAALVGASLGLAAAALLITLALTQDALRRDAVAVTAIALGILASVLVAVVGATAAAGARLGRRALGDIKDNGFGICLGYMPSKDGGPSVPADDDFELRDGERKPKPLTTWLADELDALAGRPGGPEDPPLTVGNLADAGVNLKMFTTNLTEGTPYTFPFRTRLFFFDPEVFGRYFPPRVVRWMEERAPADALRPEEREAWDVAKGANDRLLPLPDAPDLPVIVMTRFSLSFPILLSAVPLWRVYSDEETATTEARQCWFSDGGITSNFPIHFFDSPLPRWPTFGINLGPTGRVHDEEEKNIWAPLTNEQGAVPRWGEIRGLPGFVRAILDTMQNWMDSAQSKVPGYRDRIVLVRHTKEEGGMNLNMPEDVILRLTDRGSHAGRFLVRRFSGAASRNEGDELSWENHRWLRLRSLMPLLDNMHADLVRGWDWSPHPAESTYPELVEGSPAAHPWFDDGQKVRAREITERLIDLGREWTGIEAPPAPPGGPISPDDLPTPDLSPFPLPAEEEFDPARPFTCGAPRPRPTVRIMRDF